MAAPHQEHYHNHAASHAIARAGHRGVSRGVTPSRLVTTREGHHV